MKNNFETLNSSFLEPWGNQLVPCESRAECIFVNGTLVPQLVYNSICSHIAGVDTRPGSEGYCVCPPYQLRGGVFCDSPTGLGVPIWATKIATSLPLEILSCWTLCKLYTFKRKRPRKGYCLNINVQLWLLTIAVALNILENFGHMIVMVLTISYQVRRITRFVAAIVLVPVPFLLTFVATTFLATRFHRITSSMTSVTQKPRTDFRVTVFVIAIMFIGTAFFTIVSLTLAEYVYYAIAILWLTTFSSVYFVASVRETITKLRASNLNQRSCTWAKVLSNCVKHFVGINLTASLILCVSSYVTSLPQEIRDLTLSNIYHWPLIPYSIAMRLIVYSVASFVHHIEVVAASVETPPDETSERESNTVDDNRAASPPHLEYKEPVYAASDAKVGGIRDSLACTPTPSEVAQEQVVTVV